MKLILVLLVGLALGAGAVTSYFRFSDKTATEAVKVVSVSFAAGGDGVQLLKSGWSLPPERWGVWSVGPRAEIALPPVDSLRPTVEFRLLLDIFVGSAKPRKQTV
ncbi:MAG: hypothetical protein JSS20_18230, partial [Proteobacteria bacterium]|nr:hypothetical protein [Pseudomonadota bacterium]